MADEAKDIASLIQKISISDTFNLPDIFDNEEGWGPCPAPSKFKGVPFAPFSKSDRIGRVSDWNADRKRQQTRFGVPFGATDTFAFKSTLDENSFSLVDHKSQKQKFRRFGFSRFQPRRPWINRGGRMGRGGGRGGFNNRRQNPRGKSRWGYSNFTQQQKREPSIKIKEEWKLVQEIDFKDLADQSVAIPPGTDLTTAGMLRSYHPDFDRVTPKNYKTLSQYRNVEHVNLTTSQDPVLGTYMKKKTRAGNVFATDTILGLLMAATRSVAPWDVIVTKTGDMLVFDKRPNSKIDFQTVNENWNETPAEKDSINHPDKLAREATLINHSFTQMVAPEKSGKSYQLVLPNPFTSFVKEGNQPASEGYRYRKWTVEDVTIVARTTLHGFTVQKDPSGEEKRNFVFIRALNQFDSKIQGFDWKEKLEAQSGAALAAEMKNNTNKITRWAAEMHLAGVQEFRLGFVSRKIPRDPLHHLILLVQRFNPALFITNARISLGKLWGSLLFIIDICKEQPDGKYLLMRDPNEPKLNLYSVPEDAFSDETGDPFGDSAAGAPSSAGK